VQVGVQVYPCGGGTELGALGRHIVESVAKAQKYTAFSKEVQSQCRSFWTLDDPDGPLKRTLSRIGQQKRVRKSPLLLLCFLLGG
jgi:hypothetical protein